MITGVSANVNTVILIRAASSLSMRLRITSVRNGWWLVVYFLLYGLRWANDMAQSAQIQRFASIFQVCDMLGYPSVNQILNVLVHIFIKWQGHPQIFENNRMSELVQSNQFVG